MKLSLGVRVTRCCRLCRHNDLPWNIRKFARNRLANLTFGLDLRAVRPWAASAWSHTDLPRLRAGHVAAQFWAAYVPCEAQHRDAVRLALEQVDVVRRLAARYAPPLAFCTSAADIESSHQAGRICSLVGVEGGHSLGGSLSVLRTLYAVGVRYLTLTSTCNTPWADCSLVDNPGQRSENKGLTKFGKVVVREMNRLGMMVDLSHVSVRTMEDALAASRAPVIFSHSSARALCNSSRNVPDSVLRKVALNRGLVMVNFYSQFLTCSQDATVADAAAHIEHVRGVAGVDSVGLGAGYDGINSTPRGLEDVSGYPALFAHLLATGRWSEADLRKLAGLNMLRVMRAAEQMRDAMQLAGIPPYEADPPLPPTDNCSSSRLHSRLWPLPLESRLLSPPQPSRQPPAVGRCSPHCTSRAVLSQSTRGLHCLVPATSQHLRTGSSNQYQQL
ncbi:dipeptidase 1-like [Schistocerca gregaria]|uniref:dipeptidase 1-like n=1 Tax=Schistocerca gregaria TaxID=7010 RepID=UPI00211E8108|nr:dipeptidase 1-like [Schistocerca gregaria]